ncbi:DnaJ domain-containing protein [Halorientalis marina]|uniref:DnaJ domain-containing protein n=1 Tax=Halorientalis marina TaxID=2931976 RepID=UPI001FF2C922|nr:DnaJ domain-containing protein [Halorientalis marina]
MAESYYETLDVSPDASPEEIRAAYRAKVKETHPDVSDEPDARERFQRVQRAKEILTDEDERERYDRLGHESYVDGIVNPEVDADDTAGNADAAASDAADGDAADADSAAADADSAAADADSAAADATGTADAGGVADGGTAGHATGASGPAGSARRTDAHVSESEAESWAKQGATQRQRRQAERSGTAYATRTTTSHTSFDGLRVPLTPRTAITMVTTFALYPVFVFSAVFPRFPLSVNVVLGLCTLFVIAYLVSMPEVAIVVFGTWSLLAPLLLLSVQELSLFSLVGMIALVASWFPLGLALLARSALRA